MIDKKYEDILDKLWEKMGSMPEGIERINFRDRLNSFNGDEFSLLDLVIKLGYVDLVEEMIKRGIDINKVDKGRIDGTTPLERAVTNHHPEIASVLVENGAQFDKAAYKGITPLHLAAREGYTDVVKKMVENGANIELKDDDGKTPLRYAADFNRSDTVNFLMDNNANANEVLGEKLLHITAVEENILQGNKITAIVEKERLLEDINIAKKMLEKGASMNLAMDYFGKNGGNLSFLMNTWEKYQPSSLKETLTFLQQDVVNQDTLNKDVAGQDKSPKDMKTIKDYGEPEAAPNIPSQYSVTDKASNSNISITVDAFKRGR